MKVVFFGSSTHVIPIIEVLKENFDLCLVVTTEKSEGAVPNFCQQNKIQLAIIRQFDNLTILELQKILENYHTALLGTNNDFCQNYTLLAFLCKGYFL